MAARATSRTCGACDAGTSSWRPRRCVTGRSRGGTCCTGRSRASPSSCDSPARLVYPGNCIPLSATLLRTDAVREAGEFVHGHGVADLDLWIRLLERGTGGGLAEGDRALSRACRRRCPRTIG